MLFRPKRNRRRVDLAKKTEEVKAAARTHGPVVLKLLASAIASAALVYGGIQAWHWATTSPTFALSDVRWTGTSRATDAQLTRLGGIIVGANLVTLDTNSIERALATHPWVKHVSVRRHFPSKLDIEVQEHEPVAVISLGDLYLVNREGEPFKRLQAGELFDLPLITGIEREAFAAKRDESIAQVRDALALIERYSRSATAKGRAISELNLSGEGVTLFTTTGEEARLGEGSYEEKFSRLDRVRRELESRKLTAQLIRLDNRARPTWVTVQPKLVALGPLNTAGSPEKSPRLVK